MLGHRTARLVPVPQAFARILRTRGLTMRVGMEASGHARWFECLLSELQFELWIGGAAAVRTKWGTSRRTHRF
jgi:transposase